MRTYLGDRRMEKVSRTKSKKKVASVLISYKSSALNIYDRETRPRNSEQIEIKLNLHTVEMRTDSLFVIDREVDQSFNGVTIAPH